MSPLLTTIFSAIGAVCAIYGTGCAAWALMINRKALGASKFRPVAKSAAQRLRRILGRGKHVTGATTTVVAVSGVASAAGSGVGNLSTFDSTVEGRIAYLQSQIDGLHKVVDQHQRRALEAEQRLADQMNDQGARMDEADSQIRDMAKEIAVGTSGLQIWGLLWVGVGTVLMAIPGIAAYFA